LQIATIETTPLLGETPDTGWSRGTDPAWNLHTLVRVQTDEGLTGVGSVFTSTALVDAAFEILRPLALGESALEPDRVSEKLRQSAYWFARGGAVSQAISGIDIALWDILGKATGQPVARLLGGCYRNRIRAYGSLLFAEPPVLRERLLETVAKGFRSVKLGWNQFGRVSGAYDELLIKTARETVGPDVEIMVDAGGAEEWWPHGYKWAIETARMLAAYDVAWFEEALSPDDLAGFRKLREHAPLPIATGEALTGRHSFTPLIEGGCADIIQPDTTKVGGLSEARRLAWSAYDHGVQLVSHGWNTAVGVAADLHLAAAMPVARWVEYQTPTPYIEDIVTEPFRLDGDGCLAIPMTPGLGIELDPDGVERLSARR
jgi:L-alanine-DL-glutamate epimerase-like enolase superfamily enzyme